MKATLCTAVATLLCCTTHTGAAPATLTAHPCRATPPGNCTFYVSSSTPGASDSNPGTDPSRPLATLSGVVAPAAGGLRPGDAVLLRRGDTWHVPTAGVALPGCSAASVSSCPPQCVCSVETPTSARVTVGAFGDPTAARPHLQGTSVVGSAVIVGTDVQQIAFESIEFSAAEAGLSVVLTQRHGHYTGLSVHDCDFHDIQWANFTSNITIIYSHGNAIQLRNPYADECQTPNAPCPTPLVTDLAVTNSIFERVDMAFSTRVARTGLPLGVRDGVSTQDARIEGNLFLNCSFNSVMVDGATRMSVQHNVFLRGQPRIRFGYGTTDLIIAYADSSTVVANNDFTLRGEHADDPDGCGIDLETDSKDLVLGPNNTYYKSVAASVNVFGHTFAGGPPKTSRNLTIRGSVMAQVGCTQGMPPYHVGSSDRGAIAFDLPNGTGQVEDNLIIKCVNTSVPLWGGPAGYTDGFTFTNNQIVTPDQGPTLLVGLPVITAVKEGQASPWPGLHAVSSTPGATLRYSLDGSRPTETSPVWPPAASERRSGRTAILVRAFKSGMAASATDGRVVEV